MSTAERPPTMEPAPGGGPVEEIEKPSPLHPLKALSQGDLGSVRVLIGLAVVWTIFQLTVSDGIFLGAENLSKLALQIAAVGTISIGIVLVLLLGEIDLSVGSVSGFCAATMAVLAEKHGWSPYMAILAAIVLGASIGAFHGVMITYFELPAFVVTLAGLIGWQGAQLWVLGETGTVGLPFGGTIRNIANTFYSDAFGWILAAVVIALVIASSLRSRSQRAAQGLNPGDIRIFAIRTIAISVGLLAAVWKFNGYKGVPLAVLIFVALVGIFAFITEKTRFGRYIYAVGGNEEAARRAGIKTRGIKIAVFALCSALAATGGVLAAARLGSVGLDSGGSDLLLLAIAGPVVAGTSLFGGRGSVWSALTGGLVMGSIASGMLLLELSDATRFMITGAVLLGAVTIDAAAGKRRKTVTR
jgi:D-xylose transport system permease protein